MYAASVLKLLIFIIRKEKINEVFISQTHCKYVSAVNDFPGSYKPEGSGSLPKKEDNKRIFSQGLNKQKQLKKSDNVAHNILGYYISNQSDATFKSKMSAIMGDDWDSKKN